MDLRAGITPAGQGQDSVAWNVLGHRYFLKAESDTCFCFETLDPPGTFVPLHIHPDQDEFIYLLEGVMDLRLGEASSQARPGELVRMPRGVPHDLTDVDEVVRLSRSFGVDFLPPS